MNVQWSWGSGKSRPVCDSLRRLLWLCAAGAAGIHPADLLLQWAASEGDTPKAAELLRAGADPSAKVHAHSRRRLRPSPAPGSQLRRHTGVCAGQNLPTAISVLPGVKERGDGPTPSLTAAQGHGLRWLSQLVVKRQKEGGDSC